MKYWMIVLVTILLGFSTYSVAAEAADGAKAVADVSVGKELAFNRKKGNCLACHQIADGQLAGNAGPPLIAMEARFPDKAVLRAQIWDSSAINSQSVMPPFGRHAILTEQEIDHIVDYIHTL